MERRRRREVAASSESERGRGKVGKPCLTSSLFYTQRPIVPKGVGLLMAHIVQVAYDIQCCSYITASVDAGCQPSSGNLDRDRSRCARRRAAHALAHEVDFARATSSRSVER